MSVLLGWAGWGIPCEGELPPANVSIHSVGRTDLGSRRLGVRRVSLPDFKQVRHGLDQPLIDTIEYQLTHALALSGIDAVPLSLAFGLLQQSYQHQGGEHGNDNDRKRHPPFLVHAISKLPPSSTSFCTFCSNSSTPVTMSTS